jgi:hypothetical protein
MKMTLLLFLVLLLLIGNSCGEKSNRFIDIEKANSEIFESTGINILKLKKRIEQDFEIYDGFYDSILTNTRTNNTNSLFEKYGYYSVKTDGDTIKASDRDSLLFHLGHGFANGMIREVCNETNQDSLCLVKMTYFEGLSKIKIPAPRVENSLPDVIYGRFYQKGYLTKDELAFITLWWYVLFSVEQISEIELYGKLL